jgi:hypothetical protein
VLRIVASAANEVVDAIGRLPAARVSTALTQIAQRYGRALGVNGRDLQDALQSARDAARTGRPVAPVAPLAAVAAGAPAAVTIDAPPAADAA